ncbi:MAG: GMC oxidoreductase [Geminicoccaceae bacterium]
MLINFDALASLDPQDTIIIGTGPAGITLARRLAKQGMSSLLLEAGGFEYEEDSQDVYRGKVEGDPYFFLENARLRFFGGTSNHWAGWCRPLDAIDFTKRDGIPNTGWPISKDTIAPYMDEALGILEIDPIVDGEPLDAFIKPAAFVFSVPPVLFGEKYRGEIENSDRISLCLNCYVRAITPIEGGYELDCISPERVELKLQTLNLVVACGGIENSRLLLWSNEVSGGQLIPHAQTLGRYWLEHPTYTVGEAELKDPLFSQVQAVEELIFSPTELAMQRYQIMNAGLRVVSMTEFSMKSEVKEYICAIPGANTFSLAVRGKKLSCFRLDGPFNALRMAWEQSPTPENRITLDPQARDAYGVPRPILHWHKNALDKRTARVTVELFGRYLADNDLGRARMAPFLLDDDMPYPGTDTLAGYHHMGGTRMASTPDEGIVDADLQVFERPGLYVLGSSVFPTGGHANPTLTIVQLALRLGDHLADRGQLTE